jgi:peptidoglycan/LPS O-acetylase OafA/YrhL
MPSLDGLRAIAIAAVLLFHGDVGWFRGGFVGVDVFFVLSGYLITSLLLSEYGRTGTIGLASFYWNRARRLLPALVVMLFTVATFSTLFMEDAVASTWRDLPWALTGLVNWWLVLHQQSYFEAVGRPPLFQHTWSLAVEAQFYVLWPLALMLILRFGGKRLAGIIALVLMCASSIVMLAVGVGPDAASNESMSHLYFGTDTHSMGLFLGAALASLRPPPALVPAASKAAAWANEAAGVVCLAGLVWLFHVLGESDGPLWVMGFPLSALLTAVLIAVAVRGDSLVARLLALRPLRWVGERSYGIYLWHWPIFQATRPGLDFPNLGVLNLLLRLVLTVIVAEVSYRFVELPVRRGGVERLWRRAQTWSPRIVRWGLAAAVCGIMTVAATEVVLANRAIRAYNATLQALVIPVDLPPAVPAHAAPAIGPRHTRILGSATEAAAVRRAALLVPAALVGDSVMLGVSQWIAHEVHVVRVDAVVGRQAITTRDVIAQMAQAGTVQPIMILDLGNNGTVEEPTLRSILTLLRGCKEVVIVNARVPRPWQDDNDVLMSRVVPEYPNAVLANWYAASAGHPEFFAADGVHPDLAGAQVYAHTIVVAIETKAAALAREHRRDAASSSIGGRVARATP